MTETETGRKKGGRDAIWKEGSMRSLPRSPAKLLVLCPFPGDMLFKDTEMDMYMDRDG